MHDLTKGEQTAMLDALGWDWDADYMTPPPNEAAEELFAAVERIVAAREAEAWDAGWREGRKSHRANPRANPYRTDPARQIVEEG